jgi:hypothetical protein
LVFHSGREADHSPPSSAEVKEWVELYNHSNTPSWRGAQLGEHTDNLTQVSISKRGVGTPCVYFVTLPFKAVLRFLHTGWLPTLVLIPWSRVLLDKLQVAQLVEKFSVFYGTETLAPGLHPEPDESSPYTYKLFKIYFNFIFPLWPCFISGTSFSSHSACYLSR